VSLLIDFNAFLTELWQGALALRNMSQLRRRLRQMALGQTDSTKPFGLLGLLLQVLVRCACVDATMRKSAGLAI